MSAHCEGPTKYPIRLLNLENKMIVRIRYRAGEVGHDLLERRDRASVPMLCNTVCCHTRQFIRNGMWIERRSNEVMILGGAAARADCPAIYIGGTMSILEQRQRAKEATQEVLACRDILYTVPETANLLRVNKNMVYDLINCGYLRSIKLGSRKISRNAILEFVEQFDGKTVELPGVKAE